MPLLAPNCLADLAHIHIAVPYPPRDEWRWQGSLHSVGDHPSVIMRDDDINHQWHHHGVRHRAAHLGPAWIAKGQSTYYNCGLIHRRAGPAMLLDDHEKWYRHGQLHREDGPALISPRHQEWCWKGTIATNFDHWCTISDIDPEKLVLLKLEYG